jgi:REP element-mobilizing transposase RayT
MPHTHSSILFHCVFGTKARTRSIADEFRNDLWKYIGGIARTRSMRALAVGGTSDHLHTLLSLPPTIPVAKAMQLIKSGSSKWIHEQFPSHRQFRWQEGYGAFTIAKSQIDATVAYITNQEEHHRVRTFEEEYRMFLRKHGIWDEE